MAIKKRYNRIKMMPFYLLSSLSIAFIACAIIGLVLFYITLGTLKDINLRQAEDKISLLAENISEQHKTMAELSYTLPTKRLYDKNLLRQNIYNDLLLLRDFSQYQKWSQISDTYFLTYVGDEKYYCIKDSYRGAMNSFKAFSTLLGLDEDSAQFNLLLDSVTEFTVIPVTLNDDESCILAYPVYTMGINNNSGRAVLAYVISNELLRKHTHALIGEINGRIELFCGGDTAITIQPGNGQVAETTITKSSPDGLFTIHYELPQGYLGEFNNQLTFNAIYIAVAVLFILTAAVFIGYNTYRPIKRLTQKYHVSNAAKNMNEIDKIESYFDSILSMKDTLEDDLLTKYTLIQQQILLLLISGDTRYLSSVKESFMGINLSGPEYLVIALASVTEIGDEEADRLGTLLGQLSDDDMSFYFTRTMERQNFAVIVNLSWNKRPADAFDYVQSLLASDFRIGVSKVFDNISLLPEAYGKALAKCGIPRSTIGRDTLCKFDESQADKIIRAVSRKNKDEAFRLFNEFSSISMQNAKSFAYERLAYCYLLDIICDYADEEALSLEPTLVDNIVNSHDRQEMRRNFKMLLQGLCEEGEIVVAGNKEISKLRVTEIISYIRENYSDGNLSLYSLSEKFGITTRYISNLIRDETGLPYKDFLTEIRINKARELLLAGLSVTQTSEAVGYFTLPHFIKSFKQVTGYTPASFASKMSIELGEKQ